MRLDLVFEVRKCLELNTESCKKYEGVMNHEL
jgi:hypothetical protein